MRQACGDFHDDAAPTLEFAGLMIIAFVAVLVLAALGTAWLIVAA